MLFVFKKKILFLLLSSTAITTIAVLNIKKTKDNNDLYIYASNKYILSDFANSNFKNEKKYECKLINSQKWFNCSITTITKITDRLRTETTQEYNPQTIIESENISQSFKSTYNIFKISVDPSFAQKTLNGKITQSEITEPINIKPKSTAKNKKLKDAKLFAIFVMNKDKIYGKTKYLIGKAKSTKTISSSCPKGQNDCLSHAVYDWNKKHQQQIYKYDENKFNVWSYNMPQTPNKSIKENDYYLITLQGIFVMNAKSTSEENQKIKQNFDEVRVVFIHKIDEKLSRVLFFDPENNQSQ